MKQNSEKKQPVKVIGITGGVGCGKSLVLEYLRNLPDCSPNIWGKMVRTCVMEADKIAHDLQKPGGVCYDNIICAFGTKILKEDGTIDRVKLGALVFADKERLLTLNNLVHPFVKSQIMEQTATIRKEQSADFVFIEAALLLEEHYEEFCDEIWYIYTNEKNRRARLKHARGYTDEKISRMMANQLQEQDFRNACQVVIDNNGKEEETFGQIREVLTWRMC